MPTVDLVFEGGGAKGFSFVGALDVLFREHGYTHGRLLGTSAGALTAAFLAAGYSIPELYDAMGERDASGKSVFSTFLGDPDPFEKEEIRYSVIRQLLKDLDVPLLPDATEDRIDDWIAEQLASRGFSRHIYSFIERGGWFSADPFVQWMERKLNQPRPDGSPRDYGDLTLKEFHAATGANLSLIAADTTWARMLLLNHRTAPYCPVVWAARMSMGVPLLWPEVRWRRNWGVYYTWNWYKDRLEPNDIHDHAIVDGALLSNFPLGLFLSDREDVAALVGSDRAESVLGLLIDESIDVPNQPDRPADSGLRVARSRPVNRLRRLITTVTSAHDNTAIAAFSRHIVHLPAGGYGTTEFDMQGPRREALVDAGREAMRAFLAKQTVLEGAPSGFAAGGAERELANQAPTKELRRDSA
jgi:NTE family protein